MNLNAETTFIVQAIIRGLPTVLACFFIFAVAIARYRSCPKAAGLAITAGVVFLLAFFCSIGLPYLPRLLPSGGPGVFPTLLTVGGFVLSLLNAAALIMLVIAVFIDRRQQ